MTAKEYLQHIYDEIGEAERRIRRKRERYDREYSRVFGAGMDYSRDRVQTSLSGGGLEDWYVRTEELRREIDAAVNSLELLRACYTNELAEYDVLCLRYVERLPMRKVARILGISRRTAWNRHEEELLKMEENWSNNEKTRENDRNT